MIYYYLILISHLNIIHMNPNVIPVPIYDQNRYIDRWDEYHVRMPCSPSYTSVS